MRRVNLNSLIVFAVLLGAIVIVGMYATYLIYENAEISASNLALWEKILTDSKRDPDAQKRLLTLSSSLAVAPLFRPRKNVSNGGSAGIPDGYIPVRLSGIEGQSATVTLCKIPFSEYSKNPTITPMFRDLVSKYCSTGTIIKPLSALASLPTTKQPTGFVFHESRCGSTLVADMLAKDPENMVFSESQPPQQILTECRSCSTERRITLLRIIINAMGNSHAHSRLFFKFQSVLTMDMQLILEAFPTTPWIFLFRDPVEVLASYLSGTTTKYARLHCDKYSQGRSMSNDVVEFLNNNPSQSTPTQRCAAYFSHLMMIATEMAENSHLGLLVHYADLPSHLYNYVIPNHFGYNLKEEIKNNMEEISTKYSKSRGDEKEWVPDSEKKQDIITPQEKEWLNSKLLSKYQTMIQLSKKGTRRIHTRSGEEGIHLTGNLAIGDLYPDRPAFLEEAEIKQYLPYPKLAPLTDFLKQWPPDQPAIPSISGIKEGTVARFDYMNQTQREMALLYRKHEVPFMVTNVPNVNDVVQKWTQEYLISQFNETPQFVTYSKSNHFMYFHRSPGAPEDYQPPTSVIAMKYSEFYAIANKTSYSKITDPHYYLQIGSHGVMNKWIQDDLTDFKAERSFFVDDDEDWRGIHCRFGSKGVIAEAHYDGGRNFVAMLKGAKRYILLPPSECKLLYLYQHPHPEARHSAADWSELDVEKHPLMAEALATQVVVGEGEVLYIPSYWFHYIVSVDISVQCNVRSGSAIRGRNLISDCGFYK